MSNDSIIPDYKPKHVPSPEFKGTSNCEVGIEKLLAETKEKLEKLRSDPTVTDEQISLAEADLKTFGVSVRKFLSWHECF